MLKNRVKINLKCLSIGKYIGTCDEGVEGTTRNIA
jgi:hypothetical protein